MTISISLQACRELCQQENVEPSQHPDLDDAFRGSGNTVIRN